MASEMHEIRQDVVKTGTLGRKAVTMYQNIDCSFMMDVSVQVVE